MYRMGNQAAIESPKKACSSYKKCLDKVHIAQ